MLRHVARDEELIFRRRFMHPTNLPSDIAIEHREFDFMPRFFPGQVITASLLISIAAALAPEYANAQGAAGGSIGNDDKAVSGSRPERSTAGEKPARRKTTGDEPRRRSGGGGNFDGAWMMSGVGNAVCPGPVSNAIIITNGQIDGGGARGTVSASGAVNGIAQGSGKTMITTGRLSGRRGSGTFRQSDGCAGTWTASKQ
jgi:hypothetical protein